MTSMRPGSVIVQPLVSLKEDYDDTETDDDNRPGECSMYFSKAPWADYEGIAPYMINSLEREFGVDVQKWEIL